MGNAVHDMIKETGGVPSGGYHCHSIWQTGQLLTIAVSHFEGCIGCIHHWGCFISVNRPLHSKVIQLMLHDIMLWFWNY